MPEDSKAVKAARKKILGLGLGLTVNIDFGIASSIAVMVRRIEMSYLFLSERERSDQEHRAHGSGSGVWRMAGNCHPPGVLSPNSVDLVPATSRTLGDSDQWFGIYMLCR